MISSWQKQINKQTNKQIPNKKIWPLWFSNEMNHISIHTLLSGCPFLQIKIYTHTQTQLTTMAWSVFAMKTQSYVWWEKIFLFLKILALKDVCLQIELEFNFYISSLSSFSLSLISFIHHMTFHKNSKNAGPLPINVSCFSCYWLLNDLCSIKEEELKERLKTV